MAGKTSKVIVDEREEHGWFIRGDGLLVPVVAIETNEPQRPGTPRVHAVYHAQGERVGQVIDLHARSGVTVAFDEREAYRLGMQRSEAYAGLMTHDAANLIERLKTVLSDGTQANIRATVYARWLVDHPVQ